MRTALWTNAKTALAGEGSTRFGDPLLGLLGAAFTDVAGWDAFATVVNASPNAPTAQGWIAPGTRGGAYRRHAATRPARSSRASRTSARCWNVAAGRSATAPG